MTQTATMPIPSNAVPSNPVAPVDAPLVIGLVNNMPPPALKSTELEFATLVDAAANNHRVQLRYFALPGAARIGPHYEPLERLFSARLDGLIVTGTEPIAQRLDEEPYWPDMARLVDWAGENTTSTIWSCLAAQVAVLRLDGIVRRPLGEKLSGVFECVKVSDHPFVADAPSHWPVPHSRLNDIDEFILAEAGYQILSRAPRVGADCFLKQAGDSLFVLLQGHPEYGADCLLREYRRDIKRFLLGQRPHYPQIPERYFDLATTDRLLALRETAVHQRNRRFLTQFDTLIAATPSTTWHAHAVRLYARWLAYLAQQKAGSPAPRRNADIAGLVVS